MQCPRRTVGLCHRAAVRASLRSQLEADFQRRADPVRGRSFRGGCRWWRDCLKGVCLSYGSDALTACTVLRGAAWGSVLTENGSGSDRREGGPSPAGSSSAASHGRALVQNAAQKLRDERLALVLRENLKRRKSQARGRRDVEPDDSAQEP